MRFEHGSVGGRDVSLQRARILGMNTPEPDPLTPLPRNALVLVTGAAGSAGAAAVEQLAAAGWRVRATARPGRPVPQPEGADVEIRYGDLCDRAFLDTLTEGVDAVIHCAALIDVTLPREVLDPINRQAVEHLWHAACRDGVHRFVHMSTASVYAPSDAPLTEDSPTLATSAYEESKLAAERFLQQQQGGPAVTILRPSMIYGPRNRDLAGILAALPLLSTHFLKIGIGIRGGPSTNWVHAEDVGRAAVFVLDRPDTVNQIYNVADHSRQPFGAMLDDVYAAYGLQPRLRIPLGRWLRPLVARLFRTGWVLALLNRVIGGGWRRLAKAHALEAGLRPKVFTDIGNYASADWIFAEDRLCALGFELRWPDPRSGWADAVRWYRQAGWVPPA